MINCVISGGQTGADMGALIGARRVGVKTGGWAPYGYLTERGNRPASLKSFGLREHASVLYPPRTLRNVKESDCTLIFADRLDRGSRLTANYCVQFDKPFKTVRVSTMHTSTTVDDVVAWVRERGLEITLNVSGNRESRVPGIQAAVADFMERVLSKLWCDIFEVVL